MRTGDHELKQCEISTFICSHLESLTLAQLAVCQRGQCIKVPLNSHNIRIQLYFCLNQFTGPSSSEPMVVCNTVSIATVIIIVTTVIRGINYIFQNFQSVLSVNFTQTGDILPFPVFHSERAPYIMEYFFLFVQTSHARHCQVAGFIPIRS